MLAVQTEVIVAQVVFRVVRTVRVSMALYAVFQPIVLAVSRVLVAIVVGTGVAVVTAFGRIRNVSFGIAGVHGAQVVVVTPWAFDVLTDAARFVAHMVAQQFDISGTGHAFILGAPHTVVTIGILRTDLTAG
jgi:flagellar biosynthesis protein FliQ